MDDVDNEFAAARSSQVVVECEKLFEWNIFKRLTNKYYKMPLN